MKSILAENLLRFGAKGVNESMLKTYLLEQTKVTADIFKKYSGITSAMANLAKTIPTYDPNKGYIRISDGNPWLATQRAKALQQFLIQRFQGQFKIPFDTAAAKIIKTAVEGSGNDNQYMKATIMAKLQKLPQPTPEYAYNILYNFYDIDGVPHIVVTKLGKGAPENVSTDELALQKFTKFMAEAGTQAKLVKQSTGGYDPQAGPTQFTYGIMIPITGGFDAKKKSRLMFNDINQYNTMRQFIAKFTDTGGSPVADDQLKNPNAKQTNFTSARGGGGNYIFGDLGDGRSASVLLGPGQGTDIRIKRMEPSIVGNLPGEIPAGGEEKWYPINEILYRGLFPDNLITIKPDMYQDIFNKIQTTIDELTTEGYKAIEMSAEIQGFASTDNATNRCPQGFAPDHSWGITNPKQGPVTADKWITL